MTDNRICEICDLTLNTIEHEIFGGSPTFHGFADSGRRVTTLPGLDSPDAIVPAGGHDRSRIRGAGPEERRRARRSR